MQRGRVLSKNQCSSTSEELDRMSQVTYAFAIGSIMDAMICIRPDFLYSISMTSHYQANPSESHWTTTKNILKYLRTTKDMFLVYGNKYELSIKGYMDTTFQTDIYNSRSQSSFVFTLNGGAVTWRSFKKETIVDSTTES